MNSQKITSDLEKLLEFKKADPSMADFKNISWLRQLQEMIISWSCDEIYEALSQACKYDAEVAIWIMGEVEISTAHLSDSHPTSDKRLIELRNALRQYPTYGFSLYPYFKVPQELWEDLLSELIQLVKEHVDNKKPLLDDNPTLKKLKSRELKLRNKAVNMGYSRLLPGY